MKTQFGRFFVGGAVSRPTSCLCYLGLFYFILGCAIVQ